MQEWEEVVSVYARVDIGRMIRDRVRAVDFHSRVTFDLDLPTLLPRTRYVASEQTRDQDGMTWQWCRLLGSKRWVSRVRGDMFSDVAQSINNSGQNDVP